MGDGFSQIIHVKIVHKKVLSFVSLRRFGNNPFISRMFQPLDLVDCLVVGRASLSMKSKFFTAL